MKKKIINILFYLGILMLIMAVCIPMIQWILLLSLYYTQIYGYNILGISIFRILYWGGFILILPKLIWELKTITIFTKVLLISGILFIGYLFYSGEWKIGCKMKKQDYISYYNYDHQRSTKHCESMD